jgi:hypothetical protein
MTAEREAAERDVEALLRERGGEGIAHPGGTLYAHLLRVRDRLTTLGAGTDLRLAGLAHAVYGTDGFGVALLELSDRDRMRALVGDAAELLVYRYGACDRRRTWRHLAETGKVWDRFTGEAETLGQDELRPFADLSIVNELDVVEQNPDAAARHGDALRDLFRSWAPLASERVLADARRVLAF